MQLVDVDLIRKLRLRARNLGLDKRLAGLRGVLDLRLAAVTPLITAIPPIVPHSFAATLASVPAVTLTTRPVVPAETIITLGTPPRRIVSLIPPRTIRRETTAVPVTTFTTAVIPAERLIAVTIERLIPIGRTIAIERLIAVTVKRLIPIKRLTGPIPRVTILTRPIIPEIAPLRAVPETATILTIVTPLRAVPETTLAAPVIPAERLIPIGRTITVKRFVPIAVKRFVPVTVKRFVPIAIERLIPIAVKRLIPIKRLTGPIPGITILTRPITPEITRTIIPAITTRPTTTLIIIKPTATAPTVTIPAPLLRATTTKTLTTPSSGTTAETTPARATPTGASPTATIAAVLIIGTGHRTSSATVHKTHTQRSPTSQPHQQRNQLSTKERPPGETGGPFSN